MHELVENIENLKKDIVKNYNQVGIDKLEIELNELEQSSQAEDFWQDNLKAQRIMKQISNLRQRIEPWASLKKEVTDIQELANLKDSTIKGEIIKSLEELNLKYQQLKKQLAFSGKYDGYDVIMSIYAGAGGVDAQDWAGMLLRMYLRWAEARGGKVDIVDKSTGEEAGLKSVTLDIRGMVYAYGKLKSEHGVHRLVRLSPFNANNLRQTSFAKVDVIPKIDQPDEIVIDEKDIKIDVFRAGGHGGQSVNTTDSAVRVTHISTGITVSIQNERSQIQNKETALTILRSRLAQLQIEQHKDKISDLKGVNLSAEWGSQIRNYVLHPYKQVKDLRTQYESSEPDKVLNGEIDDFIEAYLDYKMTIKA